MRKVVTSPTWSSLRQVSSQIRYLPNRLMREAGLEENELRALNPNQIRKDTGLDTLEKEIGEVRSSVQTGLNAWTTPAAPGPTPVTPDPGPVIATPSEPPSASTSETPPSE